MISLVQRAEAHARAYVAANFPPALTYHNITHIEGVAHAAAQLAQEAKLGDEDRESLLVAAWFHDLGMAAGRDDHELRGAELATAFLTKECASQAVMDRVSGLILAIPFITWQFWGFVKPGLYARERRYVSIIALATIFCFMSGVAFAYFVMIPTSLGFVGDFELAGVQNTINVGSYLSFVLGFILACGGVFEMPMLSYALSRFGIATPEFLRRYRRHAGVVILIVAAIITPTPDPVNQLLLALPLYGLYEISILVSAAAQRQRDEAMEEMMNKP